MNLKRVLTPGWLLGFIAVVAFAVACFMLLAPWQLGKNDSLNARNDRLVEATEADPVPVAEALDSEDPASFEWHFVTATGRFDDDPEHQILTRLRPVDGNQVYQVLSPFELSDGRTMLLNRGWVPVGPAGAIGEIPPAPSGEVTIVSRFRQAEPQPAEPTEIHGVDTVKTFNVGDIAELPAFADVEFTPQYLQLDGDQPGALGPIPTPAIESGPYLSYGLQWIAFGIFAPLALIYFVTSELRNRRNRPLLPGSSDKAPAASAGPASHASSADATTSSAEPTGGRADRTAGVSSTPETGDENSRGDQLPEESYESRYGSERVRAERRRAQRHRSRI